MVSNIVNPLNLGLYHILSNYFGGNVLIHNRGMRFQYTVGTYRGRKSVEKSGYASEEYRVCCPLCGDDRNRCHITHVFGTRIEGLEAPPLVHCFNESCDGLVGWFRDLLKASKYVGNVQDLAARPERVPALGGSVASTILQPEKLPGIVPLNVLPSGHPAVLYVLSRGFEPEYLAREFGVGYFSSVGVSDFIAKSERLIIPVWNSGKEAGWIARAIPGHTPYTVRHSTGSSGFEAPKYINAKGFSKSRFLYNLDKAKNYNVIVVAEGPTDVWRIGPWGVALMGKTMSDAQCELLCRTASELKAWLVLLGDAPTERDDSVTSWTSNYRKLVAAYPHPSQVRLHILERGDPSDQTPWELRELVERVMYESV